MKFSVAGSLGAHREAAIIALDLHAVERRPVQVNKKMLCWPFRKLSHHVGQLCELWRSVVLYAVEQNE